MNSMILAALLLAPLAAAQTAPLVWSQDPGTKCRFVAPRSLKGGPIHWVGACPGGKASGPGMLLLRVGGKPDAPFYGELRDGVPVLGVIDAGNGFIVGPFIDGDLSPNDAEGQGVIDAFDAGVRGAKAVSAHYAAANNPASSRHYTAVAAMLESQIE
jgi:hypothetical protein